MDSKDSLIGSHQAQRRIHKGRHANANAAACKVANIEGERTARKDAKRREEHPHDDPQPPL